MSRGKAVAFVEPRELKRLWETAKGKNNYTNKKNLSRKEKGNGVLVIKGKVLTRDETPISSGCWATTTFLPFASNINQY